MRFFHHHSPTGSDFKLATTKFSGTLILGTLIGTLLSLSSLAQRSQNYVRKEVILEEGIRTVQQVIDLPTSQKVTTFDYSDGLGRPTQTVSVGNSPTGKDVIQLHVYDAQGRESINLLPYTAPGTGAQRPNWQQEQPSFYQSTPYVASDANAKGETVYEDSPLNRVLEVAPAGSNWQRGSGHTIRTIARANTASEVQMCTYSTSPLSVASSGAYAPGALSVSEVTDEAGHKTMEYRNERDEVICRTQRGEGDDALVTYYVYSIGGQLMAVLPPKAIEKWKSSGFGVISAIVLEQLAFQYDYDSYGRTIGRKVPGAAWEFYVYDKWDRIVLRQDGNLRQQNNQKWFFTKYDAQNRPVVTGVYTSTSALSQLRTDVATFTERYEELDPRGGPQYTLSRSYPTVVNEADVLSYTFYDTYAPFDGSFAYVVDADQTWKQRSFSAEVPGLATGVRAKQLNDGQWLTNVTYYDEQHRPVQTVVKYANGVSTRLNKEYDFVSRVTRTRETITTVGNGQHNLLLTFTYDRTGRLLQTSSSIDNEAEVILATQVYNELGQLIDKKLHKAAGQSTYLQSLDFRYNIRGWLTNINNRDLSDAWLGIATPNEDSDAYQDLFGLELVYDGQALTGEVSPLYNGNIIEQVWRSGRDNQLRGYAYKYDAYNRLSDALYRGWRPSDSWSTLERDNYSVTGMTYDANGNVITLNRRGLRLGRIRFEELKGGISIGSSYGEVDNLRYDYANNGNQLTRVNESNNVFGNQMGRQTSGDLNYDPNGNLITDTGKGITSSYNHLNLLQSVQFSNGSTQTYITTASGQQLGHQLIDNVGTTISSMYSFGSFAQQTAPNRLSVATPEGRALYEPSRTGNKWVYEYHIKDHLGNLRMAFRERGTNLQQATFEEANAPQEEQHFTKLDNIRQLDLMHARTGSYAARLNAGQVGRNNGAVATISVAAGDSVSLEVYGHYATATTTKRRFLPWLGTVATPAAGGLLAEKAFAPVKHRRILPLLGIAIALTPKLTKSISLPVASLQYEFYNRDSVLVARHELPLTGAANNRWELLLARTKADSAGYVVVSLQNASAKDVWFDDFTIGTRPSMIVQENHYDPWGLNLVGIEKVGEPEDYKFQFNGKEKSDELGLNWVNYGARFYDPQLGRWNSVDELSDKWHVNTPYKYALNNPLLYVDPDGKDNVIYLQVLQSAYKDLNRQQIRSIVNQANSNFRTMGLKTRVMISKGPVDYNKLDKSDAVAYLGRGSDVINSVSKVNRGFGSALEAAQFGSNPQNPERSENDAGRGGNIIALESMTILRVANSWKQSVSKTGGFLINHGAGHNASLPDSRTTDRSPGKVDFNGDKEAIINPISVMNGGQDLYDTNYLKDNLDYYISRDANCEKQGPIWNFFIKRFGNNAPNPKLPVDRSY